MGTLRHDALSIGGGALMVLGGVIAWSLDATTLGSAAALAPGYVLLLAGAAAQRRARPNSETHVGRAVVVVVLAGGLALGFDAVVRPERAASFAVVVALFTAVVGSSHGFYTRPPREGSDDVQSTGDDCYT